MAINKTPSPSSELTQVGPYQRKAPAPALVPKVSKEVLYALIDEASLDDSGQEIGETLILDTIPKSLVKDSAKARKKMVNVDNWKPQVYRLSKGDTRKFRERNPDLNTHQWIELTASEPGDRALNLMPIFLGSDDEPQGEFEADPIPISAKAKIADIDSASVKYLNALAMLEEVEDAKLEDFSILSSADENGTKEKKVAVYDVGQANCNAVVDSELKSLILFDMGWPWSNAATPPTKPDILREKDPEPVILSHWDFDHWSFALTKVSHKGHGLKVKEEAVNRFWIARRPEVELHKLGPTHIAFAIELTRRKKLLIWPKGESKLEVGQVRLIACQPAKGSGVPNDRNNNGLALLVRSKSGSILLPGDADYSAVTANSENINAINNLCGMVLPHHGGAVKTSPPQCTNGHAVVSAHPANTYGHPCGEESVDCMEAGWQLSYTFRALTRCDRTTVIPFGCDLKCEGQRSSACHLTTFGVTRNLDTAIRENCESLGAQLKEKGMTCGVKSPKNKV